MVAALSLMPTAEDHQTPAEKTRIMPEISQLSLLLDHLNSWSLYASPLSPPVTLTLILFAALTSALSAAVGVGGGTLLIIVMAQVMPVGALIPVHGMVQLGSNGGRMAMTWRHIDWQRFLAFLPGVALGAMVASWVLIRLPAGILELCIAAFVLLSCWGPDLPKRALTATGTLIAGAVTTFLSSLIGASGPLVASFIKQGGGERHDKVATFAACMVAQHLTKAFVFGMAGFVFRDWLGLIMLMIVAGLIGTRIGLLFLDKVSNHNFEGLFKWSLTLLALRLAWMGVASLSAG